MQNGNYKKRFHVLTLVTIIAAFGMTLTGCSSDEEAESESAEVTKAGTVTPKKRKEKVAANKVKGKVNNDVGFIAPFSETRDPFAKPKPKPISKPNSGTTVEVAEDLPPPLVRLIGFVNVDQPKAMLSVDNKKIKLFKVGDEFDGVKLVSIESDGVFLTSGKHRWAKRLFERVDAVGQSSNSAAANSNPAVIPSTTSSSGSAANPTSKPFDFRSIVPELPKPPSKKKVSLPAIPGSLDESRFGPDAAAGQLPKDVPTVP